MPRYALVNPQGAVSRFDSNVDPNVQTKEGWKWLSCDPVAPPAFDRKTEVVEGPAYTVGASAVTESWTKRSKTAEEISADKDAAVSGLNGTDYTALLQIILSIVNDNRALRGKVNDLIDATSQSGTVAKYPNGQITQINVTQLKTAIKALLT
jgi:hypothetical protein